MKFLTLCVCFMFSFSLCGEIPKTHRELQFENEKVKVWKTIIMPNQPLKMHRHEQPRVVVGLKGGTLKKIEEGGRTSDLTFETSKAYWLEADPQGELHGDINESNEPIEVMVIEFKGS
ncbi:Cupin domain-containing protein [Candidatus Bealeia paramacronuclearis]|uniref:Cupin domain-containing protein n=1 Tax=Candidatus Bealeia paramacronuclearis TaxID=1921001 RepID=A0ABZ2C108_9PROT|nr:Cupin domain-containing protein [Candidatus Bealeia paramacronuclearis]